MNMHRPVFIVRLSLLALVAIACLATATAKGLSGNPDTTAKHAPRVCFPAAKWGPAPKRYAPCVKVTRVYEDGSFSFSVSDKSGTARYVNGAGAMIATLSNMEQMKRRGINVIAYSPETGEEYSAYPGDYFMAPYNWIMQDSNGCAMHLGRQVTTFINAEELL